MARNNDTGLTLPRRRPRGALHLLKNFELSLGHSLEEAEVPELARALRGLTGQEGSTILRLADRDIGSGHDALSKGRRIGVAKLLVAGFPESVSLIRSRVIGDCSRRGAEISFSIFCLLDQVRDLPSAGSNPDDFVPSLIEEYLLNVRSNVAQAAWMAGDLLGDHWAPTESIPILLRLTETARFAAGRRASIHGLSHALSTSSPRVVAEIKAHLRRVANHDRSRVVRAAALNMLDGGHHVLRVVPGGK